MSRQEIDRILGKDLSSLDSKINQQMQTIEELNGQLDSSSNFIAQFQIMLQKQLAKKEEKSKKDDCLKQIDTEKNSDESQLREKQETKNSNKETDYPLQEKRIRQKQNQQAEPQEKYAEETNNLQQKQQLKVESLFDFCKKFQKNLQQALQFMKRAIPELKSIFELQKQKLSIFLQQTILTASQIVAQNYHQQMETLRLQNQNLKQQLEQIQESKPPLKQIASSIKNVNCSFDSNQPLELISLHQSHSKNHNMLTFNHLNQDCNTNRYRPNMNAEKQNVNSFETTRKKISSRQLFEDQVSSIKLPDLITIAVGVPPVKNGFGVLSIGSKIVYKGLWSNGKFQGKGKLAWSTYCYEGDFKAGMFDGYGKLQLPQGIFIGKFISHRAEGEGTLNGKEAAISGVWKNNRLIKIY